MIAEQSTVKVKAQSNDSVDGYGESRPRQSAESASVSDRQKRLVIAQWSGMAVLAAVETFLLLISLLVLSNSIVQQLGWTTNGPFPNSTVPVITAIFYLAPFATGMLARRWEIALVMAMLPAWIAIGLFTIASSFREGIFALTTGSQPNYVVGTIELFAVLGFIGWLVRRSVVIVRVERDGV